VRPLESQCLPLPFRFRVRQGRKKSRRMWQPLNTRRMLSHCGEAGGALQPWSSQWHLYHSSLAGFPRDEQFVTKCSRPWGERRLNRLNQPQAKNLSPLAMQRIRWAPPHRVSSRRGLQQRLLLHGLLRLFPPCRQVMRRQERGASRLLRRTYQRMFRVRRWRVRTRRNPPWNPVPPALRGVPQVPKS
jgi:hypothetical protein